MLILRFKASGHAAGVAGPIGAMIYLYGLIATPLRPVAVGHLGSHHGQRSRYLADGGRCDALDCNHVERALGFLPLRGMLH